MAVIVKDLGIASAYGYAKSKGYTGTEEEFAELMASYADVAQQAEAAAQDAEDAKDEAVTAKTDAQTAKTAAQAAQSAAETASGAASTKASEAAQSAQAASGSATAAQTSATAAAGSAQTAQAAAQTATTKASEASSSASAASTAKTGAETARTGAQTAQTAAETAQANAEAAASSVSASAAQIEQNTEDITGLKNDLSEFPNGNYPQMGAGYANQLVSGLKKEDQTPYNFRAVPYDATLEDVRKIVGGTIVNNQLVSVLSDTTYTENGLTWTVVQNSITINGTTTGRSLIVFKAWVPFEVPANHKLLLIPMPTDANGKVVSEFASRKGSGGDATMLLDIHLTTPTIRNINDNISSFYLAGRVNDADVTLNNFKTISPMVVDLTQDFGTTIADYVYTLETATAGAGVAWLKTHFPKQFDAGYQAYDAGTLKSIEGLSGKKTVGFNQWDEEWENTYYNDSGVKTTNNDLIGSKNFIKVIPGATYYGRIPSPTSLTIAYFDSNKTFLFRTTGIVNETFTIPANCQYISISTSINYGGTYNHDTCINLSDSTKNGTYEPYEAHSYALDSDVVLRGIPKVDANGNLYYDGDEYLPDGTVNRRYGIVDMGTLNWQIRESASYGTQFYAPVSSLGVKYSHAFTLPFNAICVSYPFVGKTQSTFLDKTAVFDGTSSAVTELQIKDSAYSDVASFKASLSGVYLVYEKETPNVGTADPYQTPQIISPDGTEEYVYEDGAFELPVGHSSEYPANVSGQLDDILDTPSANGTYTLKATVTDGVVTYSWVADA